jgi:hypothetical protein
LRLPKGTQTKKLYLPLKLVVYGDLAEMTTASGNKGQKDGGAMKNSRTGA